MDVLNFILAPIPTRFPSHLLEDSTQVSHPEGKTGNTSGAFLFQQKFSKNNTTDKMFHIVRTPTQIKYLNLRKIAKSFI